MIKPISTARFEALCFMRRPTIKLYAEEREWYSDQDGNVLGIVLLDKIDHDWSYVVLGRDELARFSAIHQDVSYLTVDKAREALHNKMLQYGLAGETDSPKASTTRGRRSFSFFTRSYRLRNNTLTSWFFLRQPGILPQSDTCGNRVHLRRP